MDDNGARFPWRGKKILKGKTIIVTGCASGIGLETARVVKQLGGDVIGVDVNKTEMYVDELYRADLSDKRTIQALVMALPKDADGLANIAGVPPTAPAEMVLRVNLIGLKYFTENMIPKLADGASIVNLASLASVGWQRSIDQIKAAALISTKSRISSATITSAVKGGGVTSSRKRRWWCGRCRIAGLGATGASA